MTAPTSGQAAYEAWAARFGDADSPVFADLDLSDGASWADVAQSAIAAQEPRPALDLASDEMRPGELDAAPGETWPRLALALCGDHPGEVHAQVLDTPATGLDAWVCLRALADAAEGKAGEITVQPQAQPAPGAEAAFAGGMRVRTAPCTADAHDREHFQVRTGRHWLCGHLLAGVLAAQGIAAGTGPAPSLAAVARTCHEANRALQLAAGDPCPSPPWEQAGEEERASALESVRAVLAGAGPQELHERWRQGLRERGWVHGAVKDPVARTHPCLVPWRRLPGREQAKDAVFAAIARAMTAGGTAPDG